jgi:hypothetical protein
MRKSLLAFNQKQSRRLSLQETRSELEKLGISVIKSEFRNSWNAHRIAAQNWRHQATELLAAGFVPSPDNDVEIRDRDIRNDRGLAEAFCGDKPLP